MHKIVKSLGREVFSRAKPLSLLLTSSIFMITAPIYANTLTLKNKLHAPLADKSVLVDIAKTNQRLVTVGERGHILYSDNHGKSWTQVVIDTDQMITAISFVDSGQGWAVGHDSNIWFTPDNGSTWQLQYDGLVEKKQTIEQQKQRFEQQLTHLKNPSDTSIVNVPEIEELGYSAAEIQDEIDYLTSKLGEVIVDPLLDVWFANDQKGFAVGTFGSLLRTNNGGKSWQDISASLNNEDGFHLNAITGDHLGNIFIAGEAGSLFRSTDSGDSWQQLPSPYNGSLFGILQTANSDQLFTFGLKGNVFVSKDQGLNWQKLASGIDETINHGIELSNQDILLVGTAGSSLIIEPSLSIKQLPLSHRLPLVSAIQAHDGSLITVGMGGIKKIDSYARLSSHSPEIK